jgi:hypothetical protein
MFIQCVVASELIRIGGGAQRLRKQQHQQRPRRVSCPACPVAYLT